MASVVRRTSRRTTSSSRRRPSATRRSTPAPSRSTSTTPSGRGSTSEESRIRDALDELVLRLEHVGSSPDTNVYLHVFSADCDEVDRMLRFRDRLRAHRDERELYAATKRDLASRQRKYVQQHADAKTAVVREILARAEIEAAPAPE